METMIQLTWIMYLRKMTHRMNGWLKERLQCCLTQISLMKPWLMLMSLSRIKKKGHASPLQPPLRRSTTMRKKGKNVATSSSQGSQHRHSHELEMTRNTLERVTGARDKSTSHSSGLGGPLSKARQWSKDPTLQYTRKSKHKSTHTQTQSHRLATQEVEEEHKTSSSRKSGSPQGDQAQNEQAYEGSDGGDGEENIIVHDPLHAGQSKPCCVG